MHKFSCYCKEDELHGSILRVSYSTVFYEYYSMPYWRNLKSNK